VALTTCLSVGLRPKRDWETRSEIARFP
jgi:hypothetical protein